VLADAVSVANVNLFTAEVALPPPKLKPPLNHPAVDAGIAGGASVTVHPPPPNDIPPVIVIDIYKTFILL
jgi:hypothetical protein